MSNNYSADKNISSVNDSLQNSAAGTGQDAVSGTLASAPLPNPVSGQVPPPPSATPPNSAYSNGQRRMPPGTQLSNARYKIERLVAAGGMGAVYRAIDTRFNRPCAVKEMLDEFQNETERTQAVEWFSREATLLLDLNHPCIPRVRDFFMEYGKHYLVMDFIEGRTLGLVLEKEGNVIGVNGTRGVTEDRARTWTRQICSVLSYLHTQAPPIIFRDLKPSNIMVTDRDEIKLIDFGIARTFQSQRQATIIMTIGYAPPEQLHGMPEPRSDLYALGATMHRVLTNHDAANNKPSIFSFPPLRTLRPDLSPQFEHIIMRALAPNLEQRWPSAAEMERALINLPPVTIVPPTVSISTPPISGPRQPSQPISSASPLSGASGPVTRGVTGPAGTHITAALQHLAAKRVEPAYAAVMQAHPLEPNNPLVHKIFGQVFARRMPPRPDLAIRAYNRSLELDREDAETHKLVGDVSLFLTQQPQSAIPAYIESIRLNPRDWEAHMRLGQAYEKTQQLEDALREFNEAAQLSPKQPAVHYALGQLALRLNQLSLAEHAFVQVLIINPADHQTRFLLSQVYERENKLEDALRECSYILQPMGTNPAVQQMYNRLRASLGR